MNGWMVFTFFDPNFRMRFCCRIGLGKNGFNRNLDKNSDHIGTKVEKGEKWIATLWVWEPSWSPNRYG